MPTKTKYSNFKKTALVLSGGFTKAASWHTGVALGLEEIGFKIGSKGLKDQTSDTISTFVGSSAGALMATIFSAGVTPMDFARSQLNPGSSTIPRINYQDILKLNLEMNKAKGGTKSFFIPPQLLFFYQMFLRTNGIFSTKGLVEYLEKNVTKNKRFEDIHNDLFIVATQLDTSRKVIFSKFKYPSPKHDPNTNYYNNFEVSQAVGASMSAPPVYCPFPMLNPRTKEINYFIDGEIRETLSTHAAVDNNCDLIISSWTHTPYSFKQEVGSLANYGLPSICVQALHLMIQKKIITTRSQNAITKDILDTINSYCRHENISENQRKKITSIVEKKLNYKSGVQYIDIFPREEDYKIFFANSFTLNKATTELITKIAYKRTLEAMG